LSYRQRRFRAGPVTLNYAEVPGTGAPAVFLHGGAGRWQDGSPLLEALAPGRRVYALDLRGHGLSSRASGAYRLIDYVPDVAAFVRDVAGEPTAVIGHSLGGHVGILLAARHPGLVSGLVVGDAPPVSGHMVPAHAPAVRASLARFRQLSSRQSGDEIAASLRARPGDDATKPREAGESWVAQRAGNLLHTDPSVLDVVQDATAMNEGYDAGTVLPAIGCPVLLLQCDPGQGGLITAEEVARARALLRNSSHVFLPGASHSWLGKPDQRAVGAIVEFLSRLAERAHADTDSG
jgi:pimeloyl-ACP methyl ester carboxylesterase